jgi:serine/threonine protein kinase
MFRDGQQIGPYTLVRKLGKGGFGEVWLAEKRTELVTKKVAVKLPLEDQVNLDAIKREAALWEQASGHANVLPIIDADIYDGQVAIVSEYANGGSLHDWLKNNGGKSPSIEKAVDLMVGTLSGLMHLHHHKITHRDLKPNNILLHGDTPRITDFGISRLVEQNSRNTEPLGTPIYMSPESFRKSTSPRTDIWAAGVVFYELLTGDYPFYDDDVFVLMDAIRSNEPKPLTESTPEDLRWIVGKALRKNPDERFQTAQEMRNALMSFRQSQYDDKRSEQSETLLAQYQRSDSQTPRNHFFETTTLPFKSKPRVIDSVETKKRVPKRRRGVAVTGIVAILALLVGIVVSGFWWFGIAAWWFGVRDPKPPANFPPQSGNTAITNPLDTPLTPRSEASNVRNNTRIVSNEKKSQPARQVKSLPPPLTNSKNPVQNEKTRRKSTPKKKITLDDLIKDQSP